MQPTLFDTPAKAVSLEVVVLYALGEFQSRGHKLADRVLALDRLHGAFSRAYAKFGVQELSDESAVEVLRQTGAAMVVEIPDYFAKRPYRVTVPSGLASEALTIYHQVNGKLS